MQRNNEQDRFLHLVGATWIDTVLGEEDVIDTPEPHTRELSLRTVETRGCTTSDAAASDLNAMRENFKLAIAMGMD